MIAKYIFLMFLLLVNKFYMFPNIKQNDHCKKASTCDECIVKSPECAWCLDQNIINSNRCFDIMSNPNNGCLKIELTQKKIEIYNEEEKTTLYHTSPKIINITFRPGL
ncbi:hypothetical protein HZS_2874 [Henneguya salminicola]|nr:hypothetical protein HZS_2874 [Henneguya salminicola]